MIKASVLLHVDALSTIGVAFLKTYPSLSFEPDLVRKKMGSRLEVVAHFAECIAAGSGTDGC